MKNSERWLPTKFEFRNGKLRHSRKTQYVKIESRLVVDSVAKLYEKYLPVYAKDNLLDLGCGNVPLYGLYSSISPDPTCVDWGSSQHENIHLDVEADLSKPLEFNDNTFNTVILSDVLEHIPEPEKLIKEVYRILKKDGRLIMNVPFYYWLHEQPHDFYRYTNFALERFSINAGFTIELLETTGGAPEILADIIAKNIASIPFLGGLLARFIQSTVGFIVNTKWGRRISKKTSKNFPLGYFMVTQKN